MRPESEEERVARLRLEAMRDALAAHRPGERTYGGSRPRRAAGASFKGVLLVLFVALILGGLYVLQRASKAMRLDEGSGHLNAR